MANQNARQQYTRVNIRAPLARTNSNNSLRFSSIMNVKQYVVISIREFCRKRQTPGDFVRMHATLLQCFGIFVRSIGVKFAFISDKYAKLFRRPNTIALLAVPDISQLISSILSNRIDCRGFFFLTAIVGMLTSRTRTKRVKSILILNGPTYNAFENPCFSRLILK